jgi:hypothetical protein
MLVFMAVEDEVARCFYIAVISQEIYLGRQQRPGIRKSQKVFNLVQNLLDDFERGLRALLLIRDIVLYAF